MIIIRNDVIPFKGYKAINLFGVLFCRTDAKIDEQTITHESIHTKQMLETLIIPYYIWYCIEYLIRICMYRDSHKAYRKIAFEQEAYTHEDEPSYPKDRKWYAWTRYY